MTPRLYREIDDLAAYIGADSWILVRQRRHVVVDFTFDAGSIRQVFASTPSDCRAHRNRRATAARAIRRVAG